MTTTKKAKVTVKPAEAVSKSHEAVEQAVRKGTETLTKNYEQAVQAGTESLARNYEQAVAVTKEQVEKLVPQAVKGFDDLTSFGKDNVQALVDAGTIAVKGFEKIGQEFAEFNRQAMQANMAKVNALFGVKSFQEAIELQTGFARDGFDTLVAEGTKISELSIKVANEATEPLNSRFNKAMETFVKPMV